METIVIIIAIILLGCVYAIYKLHTALLRLSDSVEKSRQEDFSRFKNSSCGSESVENSRTEAVIYENIAKDLAGIAEVLRKQTDVITALLENLAHVFANKGNTSQIEPLIDNIGNISKKMTMISYNQEQILVALTRSNDHRKLTQDSLREIAYFAKYPPKRRIRK